MDAAVPNRSSAPLAVTSLHVPSRFLLRPQLLTLASSPSFQEGDPPLPLFSVDPLCWPGVDASR
jgi:hypothetical protein